jgi:hypothetical protein
MKIIRRHANASQRFASTSFFFDNIFGKDVTLSTTCSALNSGRTDKPPGNPRRLADQRDLQK